MKIDKNSSDYVKIYRFDNKGFFCKPYNSDTYDHVFEFIDTEVTDLILINQKILKKNVYTPKYNDNMWSGCFCFISEYVKNITSDDGPLKMRKGHKLNIALLPKKTKIWVRNCSHLGKTEPFFNRFIYPIEHEGQIKLISSSQSFNCYCWVRMSVELALERIELWKINNTGCELPEWLTEFYLLEDQLGLIYPLSLWDRFILHIKNFKIIIARK
ncbi:TPA: hypothetical protein ACR3Z0_004422 [Bacillus thuringiensis]|uniref:Uncharacterized protein n=3 Tax=Bacillus cereus group TaxID=86661 RepID=A0A9X6Q8R8_BACTU|nr:MULTISPECIES: hypothetical protein [Bacillus cereus group]ETE90727.1 hypothetical protein C621_0220080 [Bacillus thuringiensis serovar aizawai str. Leapi01]ETE99361.1 hypothetical protein C623_0204530 [Bacillus thuringiensis serovar aizawai str. Hu4-2]KAB1373288.1 hypothetical protein FPG93_29410 [Bacillus thuringiensis]KLA17976.1 hypothetical protein B4158_6138 [Bacillus cereus]KMP97389.1 hypothetical protein TU66_30190 [Bacillus cereus]